MRFIPRRFIKAFSLLALIVFANSIFYPSISYALTSGQFQPEYTSYEDASATDMVNMLTGDFNFNLPILSVPVGNQGNFTLPLSYHANIGPEQEASWVGLGWNVNCGSLTRNINAFPDDANKETQTISVKDLTGDRGWYSSTLVGTYGWDSHAGKYGSVFLGGASLNYDESGSTVGFFGFSIGKNSGFDAGQFAFSVARVVSDIVTHGAAEVGYSISDAAIGITVNTIQAATFSPPQAPNLNGYWDYSSHKDSKLLGAYTNYWYWLDKSRTEEMYGTLYLDKVQPVPYVSAAPLSPVKVNINGVAQTPMQFPQYANNSGKGAASDINIDLSATNYFYNASPAMLAYDNFYVSGPGASGSIRPYRMELGSVSVPREMTQNHIRLSTVPFLDYGSNKVPFIFEGSQGNSYINHVGNSSGTVTSPAFNFGLSTSGIADCNTRSIQHNLNDVILSPTQRLGSGLTSRKKLQQGQYVDWLTNAEIKNTTGKFSNTSYMDCFPGNYRTSFRKNYLFGGTKKYYGTSVSNNVSNGTSTITLDQALTADDIQALSNLPPNTTITVEVDEVLLDDNGNPYYNILAPYTVHVTLASGNQLTVDNPAITMGTNASLITITAGISAKPDNAIGGFVVTSADGMNYHYALPIYDYGFNSKSVDKTDPTGINKYSTYNRPNAFANTWLLTAITGPDFVDRGSSTGDGDGYIDENDWGYWVKFNYGNHSTNYQWSFPYTGTTSDSQDKFNSFSTGTKEKYYLNSIETRSHVALFLKGDRADAKSVGLAVHSMRLCEIALLTKDAYKQLTDPVGTLKLANASGTKDVLYQYSTNNTSSTITPAMETFIQANALRRVLFNKGKTTSSDDYALCPGAANSDSNAPGKLTLNSISFLGRNNFKVMPDYKFSYANNPNYDANKWDGWGMYSTTGTASGVTHKVSTTPLDAAAWSMSSVKSPLGHSIDITYERDTYSSISGVNLWDNSGNPINYNTNLASTSVNQADEIGVNNPSQFSAGNLLWLDGAVNWLCEPSGNAGNENFSGMVTIQSVNTNTSSLFLGTNYMNLFCFGDAVTYVRTSGVLYKPLIKPGGNLRVGAITMHDNLGGQLKTRYLYEDNGLSSGVVAVEPDYIRNSDNDYQFYKWPGYAATPVMYGKVTVLTGNLSSDADYHTKTVYAFETPNQNQYYTNDSYKLIEQTAANFCDYGSNPKYLYQDIISLYRYEIQKRTSKIGKIKSIYVFDNVNTNPVSMQNFTYTETLSNNGQNNYQGIFSEGTLLHEIVLEQIPLGSIYHHKAQRTTVLNYPYSLQKVTTTNVDGQTIESTNTNWDFITGGVTEKQDKSPLGLRTKTVYQPAYTAGGTEYNKLGSKALDPSYKNMLTQIAATYQYRIDDQGHELGLIGASATTWKKNMTNYRTIQSGYYGNSNDLYDLDNNGTITQAEIDAQQVWRKSESYSWLGGNARVNSYNLQTFGGADKFNFSSGSNPFWKKTGSIERYDHNSQPLETKDINGLYSAVKFGYNNTLPILSASNAAYEEVGYSGAEDRLTATPTYLGGEIGIGSGGVVSTPAHTGSSALVLSSGKGFVFRSSSVVVGKNYRASVWTTNSSFGQLYYNDGADHLPTQVVSQPITLPNNKGTWYRLDIIVTATKTSIEAGVTLAPGATGQIYFDDFRFQPVDAAVSCNVYNPATRNLEYVLDNNNVYTRYEYNDGGILTKTYVESLKTGQIGEKLVSETRYDYKRLHVDQ